MAEAPKPNPSKGRLISHFEDRYVYKDASNGHVTKGGQEPRQAESRMERTVGVRRE